MYAFSTILMCTCRSFSCVSQGRLWRHRFASLAIKMNWTFIKLSSEKHLIGYIVHYQLGHRPNSSWLQIGWKINRQWLTSICSLWFDKNINPCLYRCVKNQTILYSTRAKLLDKWNPNNYQQLLFWTTIRINLSKKILVNSHVDWECIIICAHCITNSIVLIKSERSRRRFFECVW